MGVETAGPGSSPRGDPDFGSADLAQEATGLQPANTHVAVFITSPNTTAQDNSDTGAPATHTHTHVTLVFIQILYDFSNKERAASNYAAPCVCVKTSHIPAG